MIKPQINLNVKIYLIYYAIQIDVLKFNSNYLINILFLSNKINSYHSYIFIKSFQASLTIDVADDRALESYILSLFYSFSYSFSTCFTYSPSSYLWHYCWSKHSYFYTVSNLSETFSNSFSICLFLFYKSFFN